MSIDLPVKNEPASFHAAGEQPEELLLFPGITLATNHIKADHREFHHESAPAVLEINYCRRGRIGWDMPEGVSVYLGEGDLDIHSVDSCNHSRISLPLEEYEGLTIFLDLPKLWKEPPAFLTEMGGQAEDFLLRLSHRIRPLFIRAGRELEHIFDPLYTAPEPARLPLARLKVQELILYLMYLSPTEEQLPDEYYSEQVERIKEIRQYLTEDLSRRVTVEELSRRFLINTTSLKTVFKAVYGQPVASYMKEYRIEQAKKLLTETDLSIAEIAVRLGYGSQSKFSEAFRDLTGALPTQYRKSRH